MDSYFVYLIQLRLFCNLRASLLRQMALRLLVESSLDDKG